MSDETKFRTIDVGVNVIQHLRAHRVINSKTALLLETAQSHGGYIAGGFGTILARNYVLDPDRDLDRIHDSIRDHLQSPRPLDGRPWANAGCGDIDVWFPSEQALSGFMLDKRRTSLTSDTISGVTVNSTLTGAAIEHIVDMDSRIQVITRWLQPLEQQIGAFDIYNGMVAVQGQNITIPEHWEQLESAGMLHVSTWASKWTMNRFFKWMNRKRWYTAVTPATADHVYRSIFHIFEWKKKWAGTTIDDERIVKAIAEDKLKKRIITQDAYHLQSMMKSIIPSCSGERLLEISALFPEPIKYDFAMQEIRRRMPLT